MKASVYIDMYGCPNSCRICRLGHQNTSEIAVDDFVRIAQQFLKLEMNGQKAFSELDFYTWYCEPDYSPGYRDLRALEEQLSTGLAPRYGYANIWRIIRDPLYVPWLREIGTDSVVVQMYGMQKSTDRFVGRTGAYKGILRAFDIMLENGIAPQIKIIPFTENIDEIKDLMKVFKDRDLEKRIRKLGKKPVCFFDTCPALGTGYDFLDLGIRKSDIELLPEILIEKTLDYYGALRLDSIWKTEAEWVKELIHDDKPLRDESVFPTYLIDGHFDVYPGCGELTRWWKIGNIMKDGIESVVQAAIDRTSPGMRMNFEEPVNYFVAKYGNKNSDRLWNKTDLVHKWMRMEGMTLHKNAVDMVA